MDKLDAVSQEHVTSSIPSRVFIAFQLVGLTGCLLVLALGCFVRSSVNRTIIWFNFFFAWTIFSLSYLILFFSGPSSMGFAACLVQSAMIHSSVPYAAAATLSLFAQLLLDVRSAISDGPISHERLWKIFLTGFPLAVFLFSLILNFALSVQADVGFTVMTYCGVDLEIPGRVTASLTVLFIIPTLVINVIIYRCMSKHWTGVYSTEALVRSRRMFIRATSFTSFASVEMLIAICIVIGSTSDEFKSFKAFNILIALFPSAAVLIFGTQGDFIHALRGLAFWRKNSPVTKEIHPDNTMLSLTRSTTIRSDVVCMISVEVDTEEV